MNRQKLLFILFAAGNIFHAAAQQPFRMDTLQYHGKNAIDFVLAGDGYTADEQEKFAADARACTDYLFSVSPFSFYRNFFNVYAFHAVSEESGITHPGVMQGDSCICPTTSGIGIVHRNTFFGASLDCGGMHRLMHLAGKGGEERAIRLLRDACPTMRQACIISNTPEYGGAGGRLCLATCDYRSNEIFVHELAHSFALLADEYFAGDFYLAEQPNQTRESSPEKVRWHHWLDTEGVGIFPHTGSEKASQWNKPTQASADSRYCKMERLGKEFCPVCREALIESIHASCRPVTAFLPQDTLLLPEKGDREFALTGLLRPEPDTMKKVWTVDGDTIAQDTCRIKVKKSLLKKKVSHTVELLVTDTTGMVRKASPALTHRITWKIEAAPKKNVGKK